MNIKPHAEPLQLAGCYSLDLYCKYDNFTHQYGEFPHNFCAEKGTKCRSNAKLAGWIIHRDNTATCPKCAKALKKNNQPG